MAKPNILIQLDPDPHASSFDAVVAVDSGVQHLLQYHAVTPEQVQGLVHGAMFTRGPQDLRHTAIFVGGSNVAQGEALLQAARDCFFGPMRVSVMMDASGANTTAAAAVVAARRHLPLKHCNAVVLGATGPVGQRVVRLLAAEGANVRVASRSLERAEQVVDALASVAQQFALQPVACSGAADLPPLLEGAHLVIAAGAAGVELLPVEQWQACPSLQLAIDLNAVPPSGIGGVDVMATAAQLSERVLGYGAIGVGGTKMKIHKAALQRLFESNDAVLGVDEIYQLGCELEQEA